MHKNHHDPKELDLTEPRLATYKQKVESAARYGVLGRKTACSTERIEVLSGRSNAVILYDTLPAYCISKAIVMTSENRKCMCHLDHHRRFLTKIIARAIWIPMLQEAVKTSNESNWNPIHNYQIQGDLLLDGEKKPWNVPSLIATLLIKRNMTRSQIQRVRWNSYPDTNPQNVAFWHPDMLKMIKQVRENPSRWTCPSSRACKKDPKPILIEHHFVPTWSRRTSTIHQQEFERDGSRIVLCGVVRNYTRSTKFSLSSLLESRNCALQQTTTGCNLYPGLRDK